MASPAVVGTPAETAVASASLGHVVNLPAGATGNLLLAIMNKGSSAASVNALSGWTELLDENQANGLFIAYRVCDGTEGATTTFNLTGTATRGAWIVYEISGYVPPGTQAPQIGTTASGSSTTPDPPPVTVTGGSKDILSIACFGRDGEEADDDTWVTSAPSGYGSLLQKACGVAGTSLGGMIATAHLASNISTSNPGTFSAVTSNWRAQNIVIHPSLATEYTDSATANLALTPSGTELQADEYTDSATAALVFTPSASEERQQYDEGTVNLKFTILGAAFTVTIPIAAGADDGVTSKDGAINDWPPANNPSTQVTLTELLVRKVRHTTFGFAEIIVGHLIFDTSSIPDDAIVSSATLRIRAMVSQESEVRTLDFEWYNHGTDIDATNDWVADVGTTAASVPGATWQAWTLPSTQDIVLSSPEVNINKSGETGIRFGIGGGQPAAGSNNDTNLQVASLEHATDPEPQLIISYNVQPPSDIAQFADSGTVVLALTPSALEERQQYDANTAVLALTPSGIDELTGSGTEYTDSGTGLVTFTPSAVENYETTDTGTVALAFTPSSTDVAQFVDTGTTTLTLTPSGADTAQFVDAGTVPLAFTPSATFANIDSGTVLLALIPSGAVPLRSYTDPFKLNTSASFYASVTVGPDGKTIHIVSLENPNVLYRRSFDEGGSFEAPVTIASGDNMPLERLLHVSAANVVHVLYERAAGLYYRRSTNGGTTWSSEVLIHQGNAGLGQFFRVGIDSSGTTVHMVYAAINNQANGYIGTMYYRRSTDDGANWSAASQPYPNGSGTYSSASRPSIAVSGDYVHLCWAATIDGVTILTAEEATYGRSTDAGQTWDARVVLGGSAPDAYAHRPDIAIAGDGSTVLYVWQMGYVGGPIGDLELYVRRSTNNGTSWDNQYRLTRIANESEHAVVSARGNRASVIYAEYGSGTGRATAIYSEDAGATWSGPQTTTTAYSVAAPSSELSAKYLHLTINPANEVYYQRAPWVIRGFRRFNSAADRIDYANESDYDFERTQPFTILAWVKTRTAAGVSGNIPYLSKQGGANATGWRLDRQSTEGGVRAVIRNQFGNQINVKTTNPQSLNVWHSLGYTYSGSSTAAGVKHYMDAVAVAQTTIDNNLTATILSDQTPHTGQGSGSPDFDIAYLAVWNVELTAAEVAQFCRGEIPRPTSLVSFNRLDGEDSPEPDETGGNNGTVVGTQYIEPGPPIAYDPIPTFDSGSVRLTLTPSGTDELTSGGTQYTDAATAQLTLTSSGVDTAQFADSTTVAFKFTPSSVDTAQFVDAASVFVDLQPSGTEFITSGYTDTGTVPVLFTPQTITETFTGIDVGSVYLDLQPSGTDQLILPGMQDADTAVLTLTPVTVSDIYYFFDALLVGELKRRWTGTMQRRWEVELFTNKWSAIVLNRRWSGELAERKWTATMIATSKWSGTLLRKWSYIWKGRGEL
jgi:hypothetical protein